MKITKPTLLLDEKKCRENISRMALKSKENNVFFRPHFKTHQSAEIGQWFMDEGINAITVSSVNMAKYFANHGWKNILIAFPFNILEIDKINEMPIMTEIYLVVESPETVKSISINIERKINVYVKIDTGYNRTGIDAGNFQKIDKVLHEIENSPKLIFTGFLSHFGNTYSASSPGQIKQIYKESVEKLKTLKSIYSAKYPGLVLSVGDTPSCSIIDTFEEIDEIRPGNFVFYDLMQQELGVCHSNDIAVALACPVVAIHSERNEIVIYGGGVHLSKENQKEINGNLHYGKIVELDNSGWGHPIKDTYVRSLSQEHGIIKTRPDVLKRYKTGDLIGILPIHSCMTANLFDKYLTLQNKVINKIQS